MDIATKLDAFGDVRLQEDMRCHTTFRIGGKVRYAFFPRDIEGIKEAVKVAKEANLEFKVVGKGSNLLWCDEDLDMMVIFPDRYCNRYVFLDDMVECETGCSLIALSAQATERGLSGLEFASGIPGSAGGAVFMNAGAYKCSMSDIVTAVEVLRDGKLTWLSNEEMNFGYRYSILKDHPDWVVTRVRMKLVPKDVEAIREVVQSRRQRRMATQPLDMPSAGSTFKNPDELPAWQCIDSLQLRGYQIGGARISEKHCNFVVNAGNATASDVLELVAYVQKQVYEKLKIELVMEVEQYQCQKKESH